jgi:hypothetical protein
MTPWWVSGVTSSFPNSTSGGHYDGTMTLGEREDPGIGLSTLNIGASYVTVRLAPSRPMVHALALGAADTLLTILGPIAMGEYGTAWYSIANIVVAPQCVWAGARLLRA